MLKKQKQKTKQEARTKQQKPGQSPQIWPVLEFNFQAQFKNVMIKWLTNTLKLHTQSDSVAFANNPTIYLTCFYIGDKCCYGHNG